MTPPADPQAIGELAALRTALSGQYAVERELGRGGMGIVVLARDERLDRQVAMKVLPPALADVAETRELAESAFFAMVYVDGETLGDRIRDRGSLSPTEVTRMMRDVAWALTNAHTKGIVHRDVTPENILIERTSGQAIVTL